MNVKDIIKRIPTGSPVVDLLKLATILAATVLADKIDEILKDTTTKNEIPKIIDINQEVE